jgi:PAS domain S-box-containing protein
MNSLDHAPYARLTFGKRLAILPAVLLPAVVVHLIVSGSEEYVDNPGVLLIANTIFTTLIPLLVATIAAQIHLTSGTPGALCMGSGLVAFATGSLLAGIGKNLGYGANFAVTVYNIGVFALALTSFLSLARHGHFRWLARAGTRPMLKLVLAFAGAAGLVLLAGAASRAGILPTFFIQGQGATPLRQIVLLASITLLCSSAALSWTEHRRTGSSFPFWFSLGMVLVAIGVVCIFFISTVGSSLNWVGRGAQYLGCIYLLAAVLTARREAITGGTSLHDAIKRFFGDSEAGYRMLVENSPDIIARFDRSLRHTYISPAVHRLTGLGQEHFIGKTIHEVGLEKTNAQKMAAAVGRAFEDGTEQVVEIASGVHGGSRTYHCRYMPEIDGSGRVASVLGIGRDITEMKAGESALRESEDKFRKLFKANPSIVSISTLEDGRYIDVNDAFTEATGYSRYELVGKTSVEIDFWVDVHERLNMIRLLKEHGTFKDFETVIRTKSGRRKTLLISADAVVLEGTRCIVAASSDITERKAIQAEREQLLTHLAAERQRLDTILRFLPLGVLIAEAPTGRMKYANEYAQQLFGAQYPRNGIDSYIEQWQPRHPGGRLFDFDEIPMVQALRGQTTAPVEMRFGRKDREGWMDLEVSGAPILDCEGKVVEGVVTLVDITDRKRSEQELFAAHRKLQKTIDSITDGLLLIDREWRYTDVSETGAMIIGMRREDLIGKCVWELFPHAVGSKFHEGYHRAIETGQPVHFEEFYPEPLNQWLECHCYPSEEGLAVYFRDITERKAAERAMRDLAAELEHRVQERTAELEKANRAKDEFLANMSHEIRTPMSGVFGMIDVLLKQDLPETIRGDLELTRSTASAVLTLLNDLLDLSKIEQGRIEIRKAPLSVRPMVEGLLTLFTAQAVDREIAFEGRVDPDVPQRVLCDPDRLDQVLKNLLSNALKFTQVGTIRLEVGREEQPRGPDLLRFTVTDSGIGIPRDRTGEVFEAFTQIDPSYSKSFAGAGLGLAISKRLVELMGGEIGVRSEFGAGSTFSFTIAYEEASPCLEPEAPCAPGLGDLPPLSILLVEDNPVNRLFIRRALAGAGHLVDESENGLQALEKVSTGRYDIVLMDIQMPEMDGMEAAARIRSGAHGRPDIPIVALTAYAMIGDRERIMGSRMDGYVTKPVDFGALATAIAAACGLQAGEGCTAFPELAAPTDIQQ